MDHQSTMIAFPEIMTRKESPTLSVDQAIFTSVRSPTGEGYRIIAASTGVTPAEKAEVLRRAPSHGGLCTSSTDAKGFATWRAASGRQIVAFSCHAGREHTSRGGQRVYSHLLFVDSQTFQQSGEDAGALWEILNAYYMKHEPMLKPQRSIEPFLLCGKEAETEIRPAEKENLSAIQDADEILALADRLIDGDPLLVINGDHSLLKLRWAMLSLPAKLRSEIAVSWGLNYSPQRQMQLTWISDKPANLQRLIAGRAVSVIDASMLADHPVSNAHKWWELLKTFWSRRKPERIVRLTSELCRRSDMEQLNQLACFYHKLERQLEQGASPLSKGRYANIFRSWIEADTCKFGSRHMQHI